MMVSTRNLCRGPQEIPYAYKNTIWSVVWRHRRSITPIDDIGKMVISAHCSLSSWCVLPHDLAPHESAAAGLPHAVGAVVPILGILFNGYRCTARWSIGRLIIGWSSARDLFTYSAIKPVRGTAVK